MSLRSAGLIPPTEVYLDKHTNTYMGRIGYSELIEDGTSERTIDMDSSCISCSVWHFPVAVECINGEQSTALHDHEMGLNPDCSSHS